MSAMKVFLPWSFEGCREIKSRAFVVVKSKSRHNDKSSNKRDLQVQDDFLVFGSNGPGSWFGKKWAVSGGSVC